MDYSAQIRVGVTGLDQLDQALFAVNRLEKQLARRFEAAFDAGSFDRLGTTLTRVEQVAARARFNLNNVDVNNWAELRGAAKRVVDTLELQAGVQRKINRELDLEIAKRNQLKTAVQQNIAASRQGREATNFGFGNAGDPVAKSIARNERNRERINSAAAARGAAVDAANEMERLIAKERQYFLEVQNANESLYLRTAIIKRLGQDQYARDRALSQDFGVSPVRTLRPVGFSDADVQIQNLTDNLRAAQQKVRAEQTQLENLLLNQQLSNIEKELQAELAASNTAFNQRVARENAAFKLELDNAVKVSQARQAATDNAVSAAGRRGELTRTGGLTFDERLARRRPDLIPRQGGRAGGSNVGSAIGSALIGGGFPLLFGQGAGAGAGGFVGGAAGGLVGGAGGFAGGIVGSLLGTQLDKVSQSAIATAQALRDPIKNFQALADASFFASRQQEFLVKQLTEAGRASEAQAIIQQRVIEQLGVGGYNELIRLGGASSELNKALGELGLQMQSAVAGPLADFLTWLADVTKAAATPTEEDRQRRRNQEIREGLTPELRKQLDKERGAIIAKYGLLGTPDNPTFFRPIPREEQAIFDAFAPLSVKPKPKQEPLTPEAQRAQYDQLIATQDRLEALRREGVDLERANTEFRTSQENEIFSLRKRAADIDRQVADFRREVEDTIFAKQQENQRKAAELARSQAQQFIEERDLAAQAANQLPVSAGGGQSQLLAINDEYIRRRAEGEADLRQKEINTKLDILDIERKGKALALDIEKKIKEISDSKQSYARDVKQFELTTQVKIADLQRRAADYALKKYRDIYDLLSGLPGSRVGQVVARSSFITDPKDRSDYQQTFTADEDARRQAQQQIDIINKSTRTPQQKEAAESRVLVELRRFLEESASIRTQIEQREARRSGNTPSVSVGRPPQPGGVGDTATLFDRVAEQNQQAVELRQREMDAARNESRLKNLQDQLNVTRETAAVLQQFVQPMIDFNQQLGDAAAYQREYGELIRSGALPALAEQLARLREIEATQKRLVRTERVQLIERNKQLEVAANNPKLDAATREDARRRLEANRESLAGLDRVEADIDRRAVAAEDQILRANTPQQRRQNAIDEAQGELNRLQDPTNALIGAANGVGDAFGNAFQTIVSGSGTAQEAVTAMFAAIGASFAKMAADMLAQQLVLSILKIGVSNASKAPGGASGFDIGEQLVGSLFSGAGPVSFAGGGYTGSGARAGGLDGQGGYMAMVHPQEVVTDLTTAPPPAQGGGGAITSNVVVNITGGQATTTTDQPTNLSREIEGAVVAVLAKHRRPGGMLAN